MAFGEPEREQGSSPLSHASQELAERLRELRETVRAQQFRINQLEEAVSRPSNGARPSRSGAAEQRYVTEEIEELRSALHRLEMRLDEHEEGMRWLLDRLSELREQLRIVPPPVPEKPDADTAPPRRTR